MATITKENIGPLHEKLTLKLEKSDYLPAFEKTLKDYSKKANIPGFRKGQVPASLIKKMYGNSLFADEVLRSVDRELMNYIENDKLEIFAQPLPQPTDLRNLDVNNPSEYSFQFEIGLKPSFDFPDLAKMKIINYKVNVTDEMVDNEVSRLRNRYGNMKDEEKVNSEENILNLTFHELDEAGNEKQAGITKDDSLLLKYFKEEVRKDWTGKSAGDFLDIELNKAFDAKELDWVLQDLGLSKDDPASAEKKFRMKITKVGLLEKRELNESFFEQLFPGGEIKDEAAFREKIKEQLQSAWEGQSRDQIHDQVFHALVDHTSISFPEEFLKKWMKSQSENTKDKIPKSDEEIENEFPSFLNQLKWTLISDKIVQDNAIQVSPEEIRSFARQQLFSYMGSGNVNEEQQWVKDYVEKMMKDRKYVEDAYTRIQTKKVFEWTETQVKPIDQEISGEDFMKLREEHKHHHH